MVDWKEAPLDFHDFDVQSFGLGLIALNLMQIRDHRHHVSCCQAIVAINSTARFESLIKHLLRGLKILSTGV
jgi:hypothetical protein